MSTQTKKMIKEIELSQWILQHAAQEMDERGYCRKMLENSEGNVCLLGALIKAVAKIIDRVSLDGHDNVAHWSNTVGGETVIRTLRELALAEEQK